MRIFTAPRIVAAALALLGLPVKAEAKLAVQAITASPQGFFVDSTLVSGEKDAVLVDAGFTLADAHRFVGAVLDSKKNLTTVYVTHWHPDHYFGLSVIKQAFPKAKLVATPITVAEIKKTAQAKVKQWSGMYAGNIPTAPVVPTALAGKTIALEGETLEIHPEVQGDDSHNSYVWIPSIKTVIAGDIVYHGVHAWTAETNPTTRKAWLKSLDEIAALSPTTVVPGHKEPSTKDDASAITATKEYLVAFDEALASSKSADELEKKVKARFPNLALDVILHIGAGAQFAGKK